MKSYLESINKYLIQLALGLLLFRNGSFGASGIPKLFECAIIIALLLTIADLILNRRIKLFIGSIPRNVWFALIIFYAATVVGWVFAIAVRHIPWTTNIIYEIGMFSVAVITFVLILYYGRNDRSFVKVCFYMLLLPVAFTIFVLIPGVAYTLNLAVDAVFKGFTDNVEIVCKTLLPPAVFCITYTLMPQKKWWYRVVYGVLGVALVTLVLWTTERAAILALFTGAFVVWYIVSRKSWKQLVLNGALLVIIGVAGFLAVPHQGKKATINRVLNTDAHQATYEDIKDKTVSEVFETSITAPTQKTTIFDTEPRFRIWNYYLMTVIRNPLGLGPNTHMEARIEHPRRTFVNPGPHNSYLEAWLWGGIVGLLAILYIPITVGKRLYAMVRTIPDPLILAILGSLVAVSIAIFFNDNLSSYWFWGLLAIGLRI